MIKTVLVNSCGYVIGQDHHRARLTDGEVDQIIALREAGCTWRDIADKFGISKGQAHDYGTGAGDGVRLAGSPRAATWPRKPA